MNTNEIRTIEVKGLLGMLAEDEGLELWQKQIIESALEDGSVVILMPRKAGQMSMFRLLDSIHGMLKRHEIQEELGTEREVDLGG